MFLNTLLDPPREMLEAGLLKDHTPNQLAIGPMAQIIRDRYANVLAMQQMDQLTLEVHPYFVGEKDIELCSPVVSTEDVESLLNAFKAAGYDTQPVLDSVLEASTFQQGTNTLIHITQHILGAVSDDVGQRLIKLNEARAYSTGDVIMNYSPDPLVSGVFGGDRLLAYKYCNALRGLRGTDKTIYEYNELLHLGKALATYATYLYLYPRYHNEFSDILIWLVARITAPFEFKPTTTPMVYPLFMHTRCVGGEPQLVQVLNHNSKCQHIHRLLKHRLREVRALSIDQMFEAALALYSYNQRYATYMEEAALEAQKPKVPFKSTLMHNCRPASPGYTTQMSKQIRVKLLRQDILPEYVHLVDKGMPRVAYALHIADPISEYDVPFYIGISSNTNLSLLTPTTPKTLDMLHRCYGFKKRSPLCPEHHESLVLTNPTAMHFPVAFKREIQSLGIYIREVSGPPEEEVHIVVDCSEMYSVYVGLTDFRRFVESAPVGEPSDNNLFHEFDLVNVDIRVRYALLKHYQSKVE